MESHGQVHVLHRVVGRPENPGVPVLFGGHNLFPLVEIGLRWLPKLGKDQSLASLAAVAALN